MKQTVSLSKSLFFGSLPSSFFLSVSSFTAACALLSFFISKSALYIKFSQNRLHFCSVGDVNDAVAVKVGCHKVFIVDDLGAVGVRKLGKVTLQDRYIVDIEFATRFPGDYALNDLKSMIAFGASPRASISMALAARAYAFLKGRGYVIPEDVRAVCHDVMRHRLGLSYEAEANNITADEIINEILDKIAVP